MTMFAKNLTFIRQQKGVRMNVMAQQMGIPLDDWIAWEQGTAEPTASQLVQLSQKLNYSLDRLLLNDMHRVAAHIASTNVQLLIIDVDGVLTDGSMFITEDGDAFKQFNAKDGLAIKHWNASGRMSALLSHGSNEPLIKKRAEMLNIHRVYVGDKPKRDVLLEWSQTLHIDKGNIAYIGDDLNDLEAMALAGISACPADATDTVKKHATIELHTAGGKGCVREFISYFFNEL